jgi:hypothetical protein
MKIKFSKFLLLSMIAMCFFVSTAGAQPVLDPDNNYDLAGERTQETHYYIMESRLINYALDGTRAGTDIFRLRLKCAPSENADEDYEYTCTQFTIQLGDASETPIPALENWSYIYYDDIDEQGQVFGIDHSKFENLTDSNENAIPPDKSYHVYNAFIDFHSFCDVFAAPTPEGNGIQDITKIGQKIVHAAANSEPPTNLGSNIAEGSYFKNGEITLEFKGLSIVDGKTCALIEYDSGESSYKMITQPAPNFDVVTTGSSHYMGDIYKDLESNWVQKVTLTEFVVSETTLPVAPNIINSINERDILIRNVCKDKFEKAE